jgi:NADH-ubiquinone oxidoreductase chain 6
MLIIVSLIVRRLTFSLNISWFFYLLVLVFLGGVIILIIYIRTLATNEKFYVFRLKFKILILVLSVLSARVINLLMFISFDKIPPHNFIPNMLYEAINFNSILFLILYLLLTIICVVKLLKF